MNFLETSNRQMQSVNLNETNLENLLKNFNSDQKNETKIINDLTLKLENMKTSANTNEATTNKQKYFISQNHQQHPLTAKSFENLTSTTQSSNSFKSSSSFYGKPTSISNDRAFISSNANEKKNKIFKLGYIYKRSHHQRVRNWLRRKCLLENAYFYVFHSDVMINNYQIQISKIRYLNRSIIFLIGK